MPNEPLGAFHKHEVLHTASIVADLFERHVAEHAVTQSDPELKAAAERATQQLNNFYQLAGARFLGG